MRRGKTWIVAGAIALATGVSGVAATVIDTSGSLTSQAAQSGNAKWMDAALANTKASKADVQALTDALHGVALTVAGHAIPNFVIAEKVLSQVQKPGSLSVDAALQAAVVKAMAQLSLSHLLYVYGAQAGYAPSPAKVKAVEDYETALAVRHNPGLPAGQTPYSYFHSQGYTNQYTTDIIIKKMKEKITGTGDIITPAQAPLIASRLHSWAATVFPSTVSIVGLSGVSPLSLATTLG